MYDEMTDLFQHLATISGQPVSVCQRLVEEVNAWQQETLAAFVKRRHSELRHAGVRNDAIYAQLQTELTRRRFAADAVSERQIRRMIYG